MLKDYLIAIDLDDTTVTGFNDMDLDSFDKLKELAKYNKIIIATGRPNRSSIMFYDYMDLDTPLVNYNGAWTHNPKDPSFPVMKIDMKKEYIFEFVDGLKHCLTNIFSEVEDDIYLWKNTEEIQPFLHKDGATIHVGELKDILHDNPAGAIFMAEEWSSYEIKDFVEKHFQGKVLVRFWSLHDPMIGEFYNPEINKGMVLENIRKYYNIDPEKTIAFGDGHNDIDMLNFARYGVAMGNSHPSLKEVAKYHTDSVYEHGVANFLNKFEKGEID